MYVYHAVATHCEPSVVSPEQLRRSALVVVNMAVNALALGDYELLEHNLGPDLSAEDVRAVLATYPDVVVAPPDEIYERLDILEDVEAARPTFHIAIRLWTLDGRPSRLVAKFRVSQSIRHPLAMDNTLVGLNVED